MKISLRICMVVGSMLVLLVAGTAVQAQAVRQQPVMAQGWGVPYGLSVVGQPVWPTGAGLRANRRGQHQRAGLDGPDHTVAERDDEARVPRHDGCLKKSDNLNVPKVAGADPAESERLVLRRTKSCKSDARGGKGCGHCCSCSPYAFRYLTASSWTSGLAIPKSPTRSRRIPICPRPAGIRCPTS